MKIIMIKKIRAEIKSAMQEKNIPKRDTLRFVITKAQAIAKNKKVELNDEHILNGIKGELKELKDSVKTMSSKLSKEALLEYQYKIELLMEYMPKQLTENEIESIVLDTIKELKLPLEMKSMGRIMGVLKKQLGDTVDSSLLSKVVKNKLL